MAVTLLVSFAAGLVGFLSPCVLPLLPGYVGYMTGAGVGERVPIRKALPGTLAFVAGMTLVFLSLFAAATAISEVLRDHRRALEMASGSFIILLGTLMFLGAAGPSLAARFGSPKAVRAVDAILRRIPLLSADKRFHVRPRVGVVPTFFLGAAFVFGWTPCIGPTLGAALNLAARSDTVYEGLGLMSAYSLGIGLPFVLAGLGLVTFGGRIKRHALTIQAVGGAILVGVGILILTGELTQLSIWMQRVLDRAGLDFWNF